MEDDVLEDSGCALTVRDVSELLRAQYAIITGGKSREGCPIITFPDRGNFQQLSDEEYRKVIIYLTSVPSLQEADLGFVLVVDRRNDKWSSVKTALLKLSGFFPGLVSVAYVLRPVGFLQKAISEVSNKIFKDEFKFKVVICTNAMELHNYIDRNQLTEDLDGCILYDHETWIEQRVAVLASSGLHRSSEVKRHRSIVSGQDGVALSHVKALLDLLGDLTTPQEFPDLSPCSPVPCSLSWLSSSDYIIQIQWRKHGKLHYNELLFSRQIQHAVATLKQAVEKFSANTQEISGALRVFTQKLQETEFPNDVISTEELLRSQTSEYRELKEDLIAASRHGETLLNCIKRPSESRSLQMSPDKLINVTAVERLLIQLEETDKTFEDFWQHHDARLTQCLQLRRFELDFKELQTILDISIKRISGMIETGDSVAHVDDLLQEMQEFHHDCVDQLEKVEEMRLLGAALVEENHYAVDSIQPKCVELLRMKENLQTRIANRLETLNKCRDLQSRIEKANMWCTEGVALLASQQIERCQTPELSEEALGELESFLASSRHSCLTSPQELRSYFDDVITPETRGLVQQVLKRVDDVEMMCEKRRNSLKKICARFNRPVHAVTPEPAIPLHYSASGPPHYPFSHPTSPLHSGDSVKSPKVLRRGASQPKKGRLIRRFSLAKLDSIANKKLRTLSLDSDEPSSGVGIAVYQPLVRSMRSRSLHSSPVRKRPSLTGFAFKKTVNEGPVNAQLGVQSKFGEDVDFSDVFCMDPEAAKAKRGHVLNELLDTERVYVSELCALLKGYKDEMLNPEMQPLIPIQLFGKSDVLFGNMEEIFRFHNDIFLRDLENCIGTQELIGLCFVQRKETFHYLYSQYCQNKPQSEELRRLIGDNNAFFKECQRRLGHKLPLGAYLLKPVQRITKYQLLLKDLLRCVEGASGRKELQEAVDTMLTVLKCLNDSMHQVAISGFPGNLADLGKLLMQGPFSVWSENKKGIRELRLKPAQRHIFLYEKMLVFTKRSGKDSERAIYHFKHALKMSQIGLTENARGNKGDLRKFEVWLQGRQEVYTILAPSLDVKDVWVTEIKRVLQEQFDYLKGEKIKQYSSKVQKGSSLNGIRVSPLSPTTQHRSLRQTTSWDMMGSVSSSSSDSGGGRVVGVETGTRRSKISRDGDEEEEESWSSEISASEDEDEEQETFSESTECVSSRFLVLADYNAMGHSEVNLRDGEHVDLIKVGCAGWWYVRVCGSNYEGWAPAAYLERVMKKGSKSSPSVSSQESSSGLHHATSRSSVASLSNKSEEVMHFEGIK